MGNILEEAGYTSLDKNDIWKQKARGLRLSDLVLYAGKSINIVTVHSGITTGKIQLCELREEKVSITLRVMCPCFSGPAALPDEP